MTMTPEERLFDFIESTDFIDLKEEDKNFVLSRTTENAYNNQRRVYKESHELFAYEAFMIQPNIDSKHVPLGYLAAGKEGNKLPWFLVILNKPIPAYSLALPLFLMGIIILAWPFFNDGNLKKVQQEPEIKTEYIAHTDTIYIPSDTVFTTIVDERFVEVPNIKVVERSAPEGLNYVNDQSTFDIIPRNNIANAEDILSDQLKKISRSSRDSPELDQFVVTVQ